MKPSPSIHRRSAFTLIELLVVITIIGILASMAFPIITGVMEKARKVRVLAMIKDLQVAIKGYQTEYNRYPSSTTGSDTVLETKAGNELIPILYASESQLSLNGRGIKFIELPIAKNGRGGLVGTEAANYYLVDEWSQPFFITMDTNGDDKVNNPDVNNSDSNISSGAPEQLPLGVIIHSLGPDGKNIQTPTKDDITSWRS